MPTRPPWALRSLQDREDSGDRGQGPGRMQTPTQTVDVGTLHEAAACISPALGPSPSTSSSRLCGCLGPPGRSPRLHRRAWAPARGSGVLPTQVTGPLSQLQPCRPATTHGPHGAAQSRSRRWRGQRGQATGRSVVSLLRLQRRLRQVLAPAALGRG